MGPGWVGLRDGYGPGESLRQKKEREKDTASGIYVSGLVMAGSSTRQVVGN